MNTRFYLTICFLVTLTLLSFSAVCFSLDENFVGVWLFDDGSGREVLDTSDYSNHGEIVGGAEWGDGMFQGGLSFNGTDSYVEVPNSDSLMISEQITIEFWIFPRSNADSWNIIRKGADFSYEIYVGPGGSPIEFNLDDVAELGAGRAIGGDEIPFGEWTHFAFTYDGSNAAMYINGEVTDEVDAARNIATADTPLYISTRDTTSRYIDAILDELALSNVARTADEIQTHIREGFVGMATVEKTGKLASTWGALRTK